MALRIGAIVLHVSDTSRAGAFWSQALGYHHASNPDFVVLADPDDTLFCVINTAA